MEGALTSYVKWQWHLGERKVPMVWQVEAGECGLACLSMCFSYHGIDLSLRQLREKYGSQGRGACIKQLREIASLSGLHAQVYSLSLDQLVSQRGPVILHWDFNHFVVFVGRSWGRYVIYDPARGVCRVSLNDLSKHFTGIAMLLKLASQTPVALPAPMVPALSLSKLLYSPSIFSQLTSIVLMSVILQACLFMAPLYIQTVVDDVVLRFDEMLLTSLALGFGLLLVFQIAVQYLRDTIVLRFASSLHLQFGERLFRHLLSLPLRFFNGRHIGDIQSRFNSVDYFRDVLSQQLAISIVDGVLALAALLAMFAYSPLLGSLVLVVSLISAAIAWGLGWFVRRSQERAIQQRAGLDGHFIESVSYFQSLSQLNLTVGRADQWCDKLADFTHSDMHAKHWQIRLDTVLRSLQGIEHIVVIYFAALAVMQQQLTIGMLFAFLAYKGRFSNASQSLVAALMTLRILPMHKERIEDIATTERQNDIRIFAHHQDTLLSFCHGHFRMDVQPGECVAIAGPSGSGKSTLMRKLLGLESHDGHLSWSCRRRDIAAVLQGDGLLSGSLTENISQFDSSLDQARLMRVCCISGVDKMLSALPMGLDTMVGEYGHPLSAGQSQRVQLARALYHSPTVLLLDEATSHLDVEAEKSLMQSLKDPALNLTIIMVAHRPDCLAAADRVVTFSET